MRRKRLLRRSAAFASFALVLYLGGCWLLAGKYLSPTRNRAHVQPWMARQEVSGESCFVTKNIAAGESVPVVFVLAHGLGGNRNQFADSAETLARHGYGALLPPMTGQDASAAERIGFGSDESTELAKICDAARELPGHPKVIVGGVSMGGAAAWLATEKCDVDGVITESAFADFESSSDAYLDRALPFGHILLHPVIDFGLWRSGIDTGAIRPERAAKAFRGPAVVIHAGNDRVIPISHGERLAQAAGVPLRVMPGANHAYGRELEPERYDGYLLELARRVLAK